MNQQVNLYQPIFRRQRKILSAKAIAQAGIALAAGMACIYGFAHWQVIQLERNAAAMKSQEEQAQAQLAKISAEMAVKVDDTAIKAQIASEQEAIASMRGLLRWLDDHRPSESGGFSPHLTGLARQHQPGDLWLDGVHLRDRGTGVTLEGGAQDPAAVVRYLRRLGSEPAFAGLEFDNLEIKAADGTRGASTGLRFKASNIEVAP